jgi:hypothetical protein
MISTTAIYLSSFVTMWLVGFLVSLPYKTIYMLQGNQKILALTFSSLENLHRVVSAHLNTLDLVQLALLHPNSNFSRTTRGYGEVCLGLPYPVIIYPSSLHLGVLRSLTDSERGFPQNDLSRTLAYFVL